MRAILPMMALALAACDGDRARRSETIDRPRLLAVRAEPASALPGEVVRLRALVASPVRDDTEIDVRWNLCPLESLEDCAQTDELTFLGSGAEIETAVPAGAFPGDSVVFWIDLHRGGRLERALKAVPIRPATEPVNRNPVLDHVWWGDPPGLPGIEAARPGQRLAVHLSPSSMLGELHRVAGEWTQEEIEIRTFTSGGSLIDRSGTGSSGELLFRAPGREGEIGTWIVVTDGRGGTEWSERWITVEGDPG